MELLSACCDLLQSGWRFVAICMVLPITGGIVNGFPWAGASLHFKANGWEVWHLGATHLLGYFLRVPNSQSLLVYGQWLVLVQSTVHTMAVIPALVAPDVEWAVLLQLLASVAFDPR